MRIATFAKTGRSGRNTGADRIAVFENIAADAFRAPTESRFFVRVGKMMFVRQPGWASGSRSRSWDVSNCGRQKQNTPQKLSGGGSLQAQFQGWCYYAKTACRCQDCLGICKAAGSFEGQTEIGNRRGKQMKLRRLFLPLLMLFPVRVAVAADCGPQPGSAGNWEPPAKGIVTNAADALDIARMAWIAMNPAAKTITSDEWRKSWKASLDGNVWVVNQSRRPDTIGGDVIISISRCDGCVLDILLNQ